MRKVLAFTLAEVLLTMTIVGVVASMTIPTLHYSRVKKEYTAKLKNFYSRMENSVLDMEMDKGSFRDMKLPDNGKGFDWYMENIDPYMGHQYVDKTKQAVYYKDGSKLDTFYSNKTETAQSCLDVLYDVNGDKSPNKNGYDRHSFLFCFTDAHRNMWFGNKDIFFGVYGNDAVSAGQSRAEIIEVCKNANRKCTRLLQNDQWEFKGDYPLKF